VTPPQIDLARLIAKCPLAVMAGDRVGGQPGLFNEMNINIHLSPSAAHLALLTGRNKFLYPKLIWKEKFPRPLPVEIRSGFYSFVHWLEKSWPKADEKMKRLNHVSTVKVENFGFGSRHGSVVDLTYMRKAKATVHFKDLGMVCNAPIRSLALGTPVVMDRETYDNGFYDNIDGLTVAETIDDVACEIANLEKDLGYLREKSLEAEIASEQFVYQQDHGDAFIAFLKELL
jgi:hypothetical protein